MRKFLSLFAAVLVALVANAAVINITNANADALRLALNNAASGDEIVMAAGTYVESNSNYIAFAGKDVTVKAAEGAEVILQPQVPITVTEGGCAHFQNIKIDAAHLNELSSYSHLIYAADAADNNRIVLEGCEVYGFANNNSAIYCSASNKLAAVTISNCSIHNMMKSILFVENESNAINVQVSNSTFANISTNTESYWAGVIDLRNANAQLLVDHCTFYNVIPMNTDYSCVSKITLANGATSNCIFMLPTAQDGIRAMRGVVATNCITYNYLKDSGTGIHSSVTKNNCVQADPLFVDAANGNFTLGEGSPALTMNDGQPIGDPRWVAAPAPAHTYTVAGDNTTAFGTAWASSNEANDMALVEGLYKWEKTDLTLAAGTIEFKVCEDHGWDVAYPGSNYQLNIPEAGIYTITITFNADSKDVAAVATKTGDAVVIPTIAMHGNFTGSWADTENYAIADGNATASLTLNLAAGNYEFGMRIGGAGNWTSNGVAFTRENPSAVIAAGSGNLTLAADAAGDYVFTWTYETNTLAITFPAVTPQPVDEWAEIKFTEPVAAADIAADATFTVAGSEFAMQVTDPDNKMVIDANTARFGTPEAFTDYTHRLKTSGKTNEGVTKNFMTLNIPEAGQLRIAVRTGSNSDATRTLIIKQGETELYNQVVKEDDKTVVTDGENSTNYYPYITVNVAAGSVVLSYPINGLNFYAIGFKAGAAPQPADPTVSVRGTMNEWGETPFELSADKTYATLTIDDIPAGDYQFKMFINGEWRSNGYTFHRGFTGAAGITGNDDNNMVFQADVRGAYTFTWTFANDSLGFIYPEAPQPQGCDWENIEFLGSTDPAYANQFKVCKPENVGVVNIQQPGFATEIGIYMTFPSAAFGTISLPESAYDIQGAGIIFHLSAFTDAYTEVTVNCEGNDLVFTVYNANASAPEVKYYMKNNWDAGADWTWKAMTKDGETYKLENVVFGGTGVNYNTAESDEGSSWVPVANIAGDAISAKDTVTLVLDPAAGTVTATLIGKYNDPNPGEHTYTVAGDNTTAFGTAWDPTNAHNDMVLNGVGIYLWEKTELTLAAGTVQFKVCEDHAWTVAYPAQDYQLTIPESGVYTIYITFDPETKEVNATATKTGSAVVIPTIAMHGNFLGSWADTENFTVAEGNATASLTLTLAAGNYEFGMRIGGSGNWTANGAAFTRENASAVIEAGSGNLTLAADVEGDYIFTWTYETNTLAITFPVKSDITNTADGIKAVKVIRNGQLIIIKAGVEYNVQGQVVK